MAIYWSGTALLLGSDELRVLYNDSQLSSEENQLLS